MWAAALRRADHSSLLPVSCAELELAQRLSRIDVRQHTCSYRFEVKLIMAFPLLNKAVGRLASLVRDGDAARALISI